MAASKSDDSFELAGVTNSSADDDFDCATDDDALAPPATGVTPAPPKPTPAASTPPAAVAVKQGPIPFKAPPAAGPLKAPPPSGAVPAAKPGAAGAAGAAAQPRKPALVPPPATSGAGGKTAAHHGAGAAAGAASTAAAAGAVKSPAAMAAAAPAAVTAGASPSAATAAKPNTSARPQPLSSTEVTAASPAASPAAGARPAGAAAAAADKVTGSSGTTGTGTVSPGAAGSGGPSAAAAAPAAGGGTANNSSSGSSGGISKGGWGTWLAPSNLGGLSSKLQAVALGAAKDLQDLTASVQQAVAEVVAADDVTEVDRLAEYQARPVRRPQSGGQQQQQQGPGSGAAAGEGAAAGGSVAPPAPVRASRDSSSSQLAAAAKGVPDSAAAAAAGAGSPPSAANAAGAPPADPEEARKREVLARLQGKDTQLESGLKVIDDQVDALAANAAKALGSLWGGLNSVAKTISTKVEAAAKEMAKEVVVGLEEGASLVARAEKGLERSVAEWESTFENCFELFGGTTATEELEELSSECAHICNSARAKLQQSDREQIDSMLTQLVPLFDTSTLSPAAQEGDSAAAAAAEVVVDEATQDAIDALYAPVIALCNKGKKRAGQLADSAAAAVAAAVESQPSPPPLAAEAAADTSSGSSPQQPQQEQAEGGDAQPQPLSHQQLAAAALSEALQSVRSAAVKSLAEVAAGQIMVLLTMGRSVAALPRYGKPLDDGLQWASEPESVAGLIRSHVQLMIADTQEVCDAFQQAASKVAAHMPADKQQQSAAEPAAAQEQLREKAAAAAAEVDADAHIALTYVRDSYGKLLYVVLLASLHKAGKDGEEVNRGADTAAEAAEAPGAAAVPAGQTD